jgi:Common central domain of tyrosinase
MDSNRIAVTMVTNPTYADYDLFATNRAGKPTIAEPSATAPLAERMVWRWSGSLEAIHNLYHVLIGGWPSGGHMSQVPCAAFDPIFWAHHGNIERLFTIWQAVHPNNWFSDSNLAGSPLVPFIKPRNVGDSQNKFWSSTLARKAEDFGYTYPDLIQSNISVAERFRGLYSWSIPRVPGAPKQPPPANMKPRDVSNSEFFKAPPTGPRANLLSLRDVQDLPQPLVTHIQELQVPMGAKLDKSIAWDWFVDDHVER